MVSLHMDLIGKENSLTQSSDRMLKRPDILLRSLPATRVHTCALDFPSHLHTKE